MFHDLYILDLSVYNADNAIAENSRLMVIAIGFSR